LLDAAGLKQPSEYKGRPILPFEGHSLRPLLAGEADAARPADEVVSWELFDGRAARRGNWKAVYLAPGRSPYLPAQGTGDWELYDLAADPGETNNLAATQPERLRELVDAWKLYAEAKGVIVPPAAAPKPAN
jgi:arylsulfatase A-like enzyme